MSLWPGYNNILFFYFKVGDKVNPFLQMMTGKKVKYFFV